MDQKETEIQFIDKKYSWKSLTLWDFLNEGNIPDGWENFFLQEDIQQDLWKLSQLLEKETQRHIVYPPIYQVFRAFMPLEKIKVVTLAMDPYHNGTTEYNGAAVGLCFSVKPGNSINPSLRNIYKELKQEGYNPEQNGDLLHWKTQGCFMLNTALTVMKGCADSHTAFWYDFTEKVIQYVAENTQGVAWLLMGSKAQAFEKFIPSSRDHHVCKTSHPSPFSAYKGYRDIPAFLGSGCFLSINSNLRKQGKKEIKW